MARPKKALLFYYAPHGTENRYFIERLIPALTSQGYNVQSLCILAPGPEAQDNHQVAMVKIPGRLRGGLLFWLWFAMVAPFNLLAIAAAGRYQAIVVIHPAFALLAKLASLLCRTPVLLFLEKATWRTARRKNRGMIARSLAWAIDNLGVLSARRVIPSSNALAGELTLKFPLGVKRIKPLPFTASRPPEAAGNKRRSPDFFRRKRELAAKFDLPERGFFVACSGEVEDHRDLEYVLRAVSAAEPAQICLFLPAEGPARRALEAIAVSLGLYPQVVFFGAAAAIADVAAGCDLFVVPGGYQGLPAWLVHILSTGTPMIGARSPENKELLAHDDLLFEPDDVETLGRTLRGVATSPKRLEQILELTAERATHFQFDWGAQVAELVENAKSR